LSELSERISEIRKHAGLSQGAFGDRINLSRNFVWMLENGKRLPSDRTIADICREFNVNEQWLRTGQGDMLSQESRDQELERVLKSSVTSKEALGFFIDLFKDMTDEEILLMYNAFQRHFPK
jgi:transcriptional regulator with XRE-family HTH domain